MARIPTSRIRLVLAGAMCLIGTLPVSACQDVAIDPLALAVASETHGAVLLSQALPSMPVLLAETGIAGEGSADVDAWWESWRMESEEGERVRSRLYASTARRLLPALGEPGVRDLLARNRENLRAVESVGALFPSGAVHAALAEARSLHERSEAALQAGDGTVALTLALRSVDAQWAVSPEQVASSLLEQAQHSLRRNERSGTYSEEQLTRIRRLTSGAQEAMEAGDYPRAIRRAYYACQLLGANPP
jgi:hypothetical protein